MGPLLQHGFCRCARLVTCPWGCRAEAEAASRAKAADVLALGNQVLALEKQLEGAQREAAAVEAAAHTAWAAKAQHVSAHGQARCCSCTFCLLQPTRDSD